MKKLLLATLIGWSLSHSLVYAKSYPEAVVDAAIVQQNEIATNLIAIDDKTPALVWNADKSKILVVTWKEQTSYENFIKPNHASSSNPDHATWVTTAPQVQQFCQNYLRTAKADNSALDLRLKQYLGLNASWKYDVFIEMWVSPADLFRPCVDPEINDTQCNLQFGEKLPEVKNIANYVDFYKNLYFKSFRASAGVPWTGLGYTYDWGNPQSTVGASEFILAPQAEYQIERVIPTQDYCKITP